MGKKNRNKTRVQPAEDRNGLGSLASIKEETPLPTLARASDAAVEAAMQALLGSTMYQELGKAVQWHADAEEKRKLVRTLSKKQEEDKKALSMAIREKAILEQKSDKVVGERMTIRADLKNRTLTNPAISKLRALLQGKFREGFEKIIQDGLAEDDKYVQLEAEAAGIDKNAAKVARSIAKYEKAIASAEKKITRLQAEAKKLDEAAWDIEGIRPQGA